MLQSSGIGDWERIALSLDGAFNNKVNALAVTATTNALTVYIGGEFTDVNGDPDADYLVQWISGTNALERVGDARLNGPVHALAVTGSTLYVGGVFTDVVNISGDHILQLNIANNQWSVLGQGVGGPVYALAVTGSTLYVGGQFTNAGGTIANNVAQWNGSWSALGTGTFNGTNNPVYALAVTGSTLYVGGDFAKAGGIDANNVAKWDGSSSSWSALSTGTFNGTNGPVYALAVTGTSSITLYVGGAFTTAGGTTANNVAQWGTTWQPISNTTPISGTVKSLAVNYEGGNTLELYVGGTFTSTTSSGEAQNLVIYDFNSGLWKKAGNLNGEVSSILVNDPGYGPTVYVGGNFINAGNIAAADRLAVWNRHNLSALGSALNGPVYAIAKTSSGTYVVGGQFTNAGGISGADYIAQWDGSSWSPLGAGTNGPVYALAVAGPTLYVGGQFTKVNNASSIAANNVAKWNGSSWSALTNGTTGPVYALAVTGTSPLTLYVGGEFGGVFNAAFLEAKNVAQWNVSSSGSSWSALGTPTSNGTNRPVYALAVTGSTLYVGGAFTTAGSTTANNVARWNGSSWSALNLGNSGSEVRALKVDGAKLYAGGKGISGVQVITNTAATTPTWSILQSGFSNGPLTSNGEVRALAVDGSDVYAGGTFVDVSGDPHSDYFAKYNGSLKAWETPPVSLSLGAPVSATIVANGIVYAGGGFITPTKYIGWWTNSSRTWTSSKNNTINNITALAVDSSGTVYAAVKPSSSAPSVLKWNGSTWVSLTGISFNSSDTINALLAVGNKLYVGGNFQDPTIGSTNTAADYIVVWNGSTSTWSNLGSTSTNNGVLDNEVKALAVGPNGDIFVGGDFTGKVQKWNGSAWSPLTNTNNVTALAVDSSGTVYAAVKPSSSAPSVLKWNGSTWVSLTGISFNNSDTINALKIAGSYLFIGGRFSITTLSTANNFVIYNLHTGAFLAPAGDYKGGAVLSTTDTITTMALLADGGNDVIIGGSFQDAGGDPYADNVLRFLVPPTASITLPSGTTVLTNATQVSFVVTFDEAVFGVDENDFEVIAGGAISGAVVTSVVQSGNVYTVTVDTGAGSGTLGLSLSPSPTISDTAGLTPTSGVSSPISYTIDKTPPAATISTTSVTTTGLPVISFKVTFSEAVSNVTADDFEIVITGTITGASIVAVAGSGDTYTVLVSTGSGDGTLGLNLKAGTDIKDATNNTAAAAPGPTYTIVKSAPAATITLGDPSPTNAVTVTFFVTFTVPVSNVTADDFEIVTTGTITGTSIDSVDGSGDTYRVVVNTGSGDGTLRLNLKAGTDIKDATNNTADEATGQTYEIIKSVFVYIPLVLKQ
jgi:hypothetical protein